MFYVRTFYAALAQQGLRQPFDNAALWLAFPDLLLGQLFRQLSVLGLPVGEIPSSMATLLANYLGFRPFPYIINSANPNCVYIIR